MLIVAVVRVCERGPIHQRDTIDSFFRHGATLGVGARRSQVKRISCFTSEHPFSVRTRADYIKQSLIFGEGFELLKLIDSYIDSSALYESFSTMTSS